MKGKILIVDDDANMRESISDNLEVVAVGAYAGRIADQVCHVGFVGRGEGVMRGHPLGRCQVVLKHREVDDPDGLKGFGAIDLIISGVNAPLTEPNSSLSINSRGSAAQLILMIRLLLRVLRA